MDKVTTVNLDIAKQVMAAPALGPDRRKVSRNPNRIGIGADH